MNDVPVEEDKVDKDTLVAVETLENCFDLDFFSILTPCFMMLLKKSSSS